MKKTYAELKQLILYHDNLYYNKAKPEITNEQYDGLKKQLDAFKKQASWIVGIDQNNDFVKKNHNIPMLSLGNIFSKDDLIKFIEKMERFLGEKIKHQFVIEPKIDGVSLSLHYKNGKLDCALTRGNGRSGDDITKNALMIHDIPHIIPYKKDLEVRGEIYMLKSDFGTMKNQFSTPRNATAGTIKHKNSEIVKKRKLHFFAYQCFREDFLEQIEIVDFLKKNQFVINEHFKLCEGIDEIIEHFNYLHNLRGTLDYDIDGVVYKLNNLSLQKRLGYAGRNPRHSIAHKFSAEYAQTRIEDIVLQVGRSGAVTPVALLRPVMIGGVVISRCTLHNFEEIIRKDIRINDEVKVVRAGDVIPYIESVIVRDHKNKKFILPTNCPSCALPLMHENKLIYCKNLSCHARKIEQLKHFCSKEAMNIVSLGSSHIEAFYHKNFVRTPDEFYTLHTRIYLQNLENWGEVSAKNLYEAIRNSQKIPLNQLIYALGIPEIGQMNAMLLAKTYQTFEKFYKSTKEDLEQIDGIGEKTAIQIINYLTKNCIWIEKLIKHLEIDPYVAPVFSENFRFFGKKIIFSGTFKTMSRNEAKSIATKKGAKIVSSLSKVTDYLVYGEKAGSKLQKAQDLGVVLVSEEEWMQSLGK